MQDTHQRIVGPSRRTLRWISVVAITVVTTTGTVTAIQLGEPWWIGFKNGFVGSVGVLSILAVTGRWIFGGMCMRYIAWFSRVIGMSSIVSFDIAHWHFEEFIYTTTPIDPTASRWWKRALLSIVGSAMVISVPLVIASVVILLISLVGTSSSIAELSTHSIELLQYLRALVARILA